MKGQDFVHELIGDPVKFLRRHAVSVEVGNPSTQGGTAPLRNFAITSNEDKKISRVSGFTTGFSGDFNIVKDRPKIKIGTHIIDEGDKFPAFVIPTIQDGTIIASQASFTLPIDADTKLLLTSQLTGCVFTWSTETNSIRLSHIRPGSGKNAQDDAVKMGANSMRTGRYSQFKLGEQYASNDRVTIVGCNTGRWRFYAQIRRQSDGSAEFIRSVYELS